MELYKELLTHILSQEEIKITFPDLNIDIAHIVELEAYNVLNEIKEILEDNTLDDPECFARIDAIIHTFHKRNIDIGTRHDFG